MMSNERLIPQLVMRRVHLFDLPTVELPPGYSIRSFREGDEAAWERIIRVTFENPTYEFNQVMKSDPAYRPERVLFVVHGDEPVATASAWQVDRFGPVIGYLHMVGVSPEHQGKHLGYWVSIAVLHQFVEAGRMEAVLQTDDFRLPAIKTYVRMGFEPLLVHENQRERWRKNLGDLKRDDLVTQFRGILFGPVIQINGLQ
jgi:mycothiol synthase